MEEASHSPSTMALIGDQNLLNNTEENEEEEDNARLNLIRKRRWAKGSESKQQYQGKEDESKWENETTSMRTTGEKWGKREEKKGNIMQNESK